MKPQIIQVHLHGWWAFFKRWWKGKHMVAAYADIGAPNVHYFKPFYPRGWHRMHGTYPVEVAYYALDSRTHRNRFLHEAWFHAWSGRYEHTDTGVGSSPYWHRDDTTGVSDRALALGELTRAGVEVRLP